MWFRFDDDDADWIRASRVRMFIARVGLASTLVALACVALVVLAFGGAILWAVIDR